MNDEIDIFIVREPFANLLNKVKNYGEFKY